MLNVVIIIHTVRFFSTLCVLVDATRSWKDVVTLFTFETFLSATWQYIFIIERSYNVSKGDGYTTDVRRESYGWRLTVAPQGSTEIYRMSVSDVWWASVQLYCSVSLLLLLSWIRRFLITFFNPCGQHEDVATKENRISTKAERVERSSLKVNKKLYLWWNSSRANKWSCYLSGLLHLGRWGKIDALMLKLTWIY